MSYHVEAGILYIVATPIGNMGDITHRAVEVLKTVDEITAEDTRHTRHLLKAFDIDKPLYSYFEYSNSSKIDGIIKKLKTGSNIALVTDAGTPTLSDPGARVVAQARLAGIEVIPVPGPAAIIAGLSVSGFPTDPFHFWGFLPPSNNKRRKIYEFVKTLDGTHGFYESPHKFKKHLEEWKEYFADHYIFVAREMTKKFETYYWGKMETVYPTLFNEEPRGEYTVLVSDKILIPKTFEND